MIMRDEVAKRRPLFVLQLTYTSNCTGPIYHTAVAYIYSRKLHSLQDNSRPGRFPLVAFLPHTLGNKPEVMWTNVLLKWRPARRLKRTRTWKFWGSWRPCPPTGSAWTATREVPLTSTLRSGRLCAHHVVDDCEFPSRPDPQLFWRE